MPSGPASPWLIASPIRFPLGREMPRLRDSAGFAALEGCAARAGISHDSRRLAVEHLSVIIAAKGGTLADITVGDCLELMEIRDSRRGTLANGQGNSFYQLLHAMGLLPPERRRRCGCWTRGSRASSPPPSSSASTTWPAPRSATS